MKPTGRIDEMLPSHGTLATRYHQYLHAKLPIDHWEDIGELATPIPQRIQYPIDWKLVGRWAAVCPPLAGIIGDSRNFNDLALKLGWHYAWSRFAQHAQLLDAIESLYTPRKSGPSMVIEPGCFTGGLLHFLSDHWPKAKCLGLDVSPVALDVCSQFSDELKQTNRPVWLEADFCQIQPEELPNSLGDNVQGGLVIISNAIDSIGRAFDRYPYLGGWNAKAGLISYWVNLGCTVLLAERHEDPMHLFETILSHGAWKNGAVDAKIINIFQAFSTEKMCQEKPLGEWFNAECYIFSFAPPERKNPTKSKAKGKKV